MFDNNPKLTGYLLARCTKLLAPRSKRKEKVPTVCGRSWSTVRPPPYDVSPTSWSIMGMTWANTCDVSHRRLRFFRLSATIILRNAALATWLKASESRTAHTPRG
jgi:hypothetical protein